MPVNIPESVFTKYFDVIDSTFTIFGVDCELVYLQKVEQISSTYNNIPTNNSINAHRRRKTQQVVQGVTYKEVEQLEDIRLKVYWEKSEFTKLGGDIVIPEGAIQTIFYGRDLARVKRATELIVHKNIKAQQEMRFKRMGEAFPMGLRKERYFGCFWERS